MHSTKSEAAATLRRFPRALSKNMMARLLLLLSLVGICDAFVARPVVGLTVRSAATPAFAVQTATAPSMQFGAKKPAKKVRHRVARTEGASGARRTAM